MVQGRATQYSSVYVSSRTSIAFAKYPGNNKPCFLTELIILHAALCWPIYTPPRSEASTYKASSAVSSLCSVQEML